MANITRGWSLLVGVMIASMAFTAAKAAHEHGAGRTDSPEAKLLSELHEVNQVGIQTGQLAQQKGQAKEVKEFGKQLAQDHQATDDELMALARKEGISLASAVPEPAEGARMADKGQMAAIKLALEHRAMLDQLQNAQGAEFDRQFAEAMQSGHQKAIAKLEEMANQITDKEVQQLVGKTLPKLHDHHKRAEKLQQAAA